MRMDSCRNQMNIWLQSSGRLKELTVDSDTETAKLQYSPLLQITCGTWKAGQIDQLSQPGTTAVLHMSKNKQILSFIYMGAQSIKQCFRMGSCIWFLEKQEIFPSSPHKDHPWGQSSHLSNRKLCLFIWGQNKQWMNLIAYLYLVLRFRMHVSSSPQICMHFGHGI